MSISIVGTCQIDMEKVRLNGFSCCCFFFVVVVWNLRNILFVEQLLFSVRLKQAEAIISFAFS